MIFYVLIFGLLAIFVVVAAVMKMRGRRSGYTSDDGRPADPAHREHTSGHHPHTTDAARRNRKAKRLESRHDRRKRK